MWRGEKEKGSRAWTIEKRCVSISCDYHCSCFIGISLEMDGLIRMERQKFPFTIENILSKYPNSNGDNWTCGTSGAGLKEKAASPVGDQTETVPHACMCCCCYCPHCGDIFRTDFIPEGKTIPPPLCWHAFFKKNDFVACVTYSPPWLQIRFPPCRLSVWMAPSDVLQPMQAGRGSQRGAVSRSGAEADQTPPHHFHGGAAGRTGGAVPAEPVSRCEHKGEISTAHSLKRGKSRGKSAVSHSAYHWIIMLFIH